MGINDDLPSGKCLHNYGTSPFLMGKSTIHGHFQWLCLFTRGYYIYIYTIHIQLYHIHMYGTSILEPPKDNISMFESGQQGKNRMV